jgi:TRAP-type C4-dicarboxylate transport system, small permease component
MANVVLFLVIALIVTANILLRIFPITSLHWSDVIVELCFAWLVFYGAAGVWMAKGHFSVGDWIGKRLKAERAKRGYRLLLELIVLAFAGIFFYCSLNLTLRAREVTSVFHIPKKLVYSCMPISSLIIDEIQRVPSLCSWIQALVDEKGGRGEFVLTGSSQFELRASLSQSLAGRNALAFLFPFAMG